MRGVDGDDPVLAYSSLRLVSVVALLGMNPLCFGCLDQFSSWVLFGILMRELGVDILLLSFGNFEGPLKGCTHLTVR